MGRCAVSTQKQKRPFALRALAAFAGTLAILFVLLLAARGLSGTDHVDGKDDELEVDP